MLSAATLLGLVWCYAAIVGTSLRYPLLAFGLAPVGGYVERNLQSLPTAVPLLYLAVAVPLGAIVGWKAWREAVDLDL